MTQAEVRESFLPLVALITDHAGRGQAFVMRLLNEEQIVSEKELDTAAGDIEVLSFTAKLPNTDAILLKRPYVHIVSPGGPVEGQVRFVLNGETVADGDLKDFPIEDRLGDEPFNWRTLTNYWAVKKDPDASEVMSLPWIGMMAVNNGELQAFITNFKAPAKTRIQVGVIAALYSTKA